MYKNLKFFNKKGENCNFEYQEDIDRWIGRIDFGSISTEIAEDSQLYVLEEVFDVNNQIYQHVTPLMSNDYLPGPTSPIGTTGSTASGAIITAYFNPINKIDDIFIYDFDLNEDLNVLNKYYALDYQFSIDPLFTIAGPSAQKPGVKETVVVNDSPIQINLGFIPEYEDGYSSILYIKDVSNHIFAEIMVYGEGEEEDERLRDLLQSIGYDLLPSDSIIFDTSDVNESEVNWELINRKRKELLLEYSNIFPFLGSYKALINIIKFFGYQNLRMKEYWLNIDAESPNVGKYKQINISDIFTEDANFSNTSLIPSKIYKKTNKFGLFYDITTESDEFDNDGLPIVEEVFQFTPQEILIKIFALKKKLQNYFLPVNAKIVDIIGEAVFYGKYDMNVWNDQYRIDSISLGLKPKFSVLPSREGFICDLRPLNQLGCPVGTDLNIGGNTNLLSWRIGINGSANTFGPILDTQQIYRIDVRIPFLESIILDTIFTTDPDTGKSLYQPNEVAARIVQNWRNNNILNSLFSIFQEGGNSEIIRIVQKQNTGNGEIVLSWFTNTTVSPSFIKFFIPGPTALIGPIGPTASSINVSPGPSGSFGPSGAPISYFEDCFIGYFDRINIDITELNDAPNIPVGYPIVLRNETFDILWENANVTYNQIDQTDPLTNNLLYSNFTLSQIISSFVSPSTPVFVSVPGFPLVIPPALYSWNTLGFYGYYEMQWIVKKEADITPSFFFDSGRGSINELNSIPLILPFVGKYQVELCLWDGFNTKSFLINEDYIEVNLPESEFIGWYQFRERDYNLNTKRYSVQSDFANQPKKPELLTWDEYASTWELPLHPNEEIGMNSVSFNSLDSIEFYQTIENPSTNPLIDRSPYYYNLITALPRWNDLYHLWWDGIGTRITQWEITGITGPTAYIFMTEGNTTIDLDSGININYEEGPTGFEGATATYPPGSTGDVIVSNSNRRSYRWNGSEWIYIIDIIDSWEAIGLTGATLKENMIELTRQLNEEIYLENHPFLRNFIYYFNEEYDSVYALNPYIRAVSKNFDKGRRHKVRTQSLTSDTESYDTVYFGYLGDIPTHFEIYQVDSNGPTGSILLPGMTAPYEIGSTNLTDLEIELNGSAQTYKGIEDYTFNLVLGYSGWSGPTGPTGGATETKIQGISKKFTSPEEIDIVYDRIIGTTYGRSLIKNPTWNEIRILKYSQDLPLCTVVNFTCDPSKVCGKTNFEWELSKEGDPEFDDIYYNNQYFSYMFTERGSYTLTLTIEDTNGNQKTISKQEIIKIT